MLKKTAYNRVFLIISTFALSILFLSRCMQNDSKKSSSHPDNRYEQYAGSVVCKNCHKNIYESDLQTFHHQTSAIASAESIKGSFEAGKNKFYFNPGLYVAAEKKGDHFFQTAYQGGNEKTSRSFDFVIGSGKRGQTFLYWYDNYLFQLPLTWFTSTDEWTNSPGYSNSVQFNRPITARCLECHSTYFQQESNPGAKADEFSKSKIILGVECEKCHGPAANHVAYQQKNPEDKTGHFITNPSKLTRTQNLDLCRLCHGGRLSKSRPSFSFNAGDKLSDYFHSDSVNVNISDIDVHGNQYGMLNASKCFKLSDMTCTSCHNSHQNETNSLDVFTQKCLNCHTTPGKVCGLTNKTEAVFLKKNCIDCHMPELPSKAIMVLRQGESIPTSAYMRSHFISIYGEIAKKKLEKMNKKGMDNHK